MRSILTIWLSVMSVLLWTQTARAQEDADAHLWLEEVEGERALSWVNQKNEATLTVLKATPMFEEIYQKAMEILDSDQRIAYPSFQGEYIYNFWQDAKNERGLWRRTTLEEYLKASPKWEVLLDIDRLCREEGEQWVYKGATGLYPDYTLYLVYLSRGGSDAVVVREFDADTKQFVKDGFYLPQAKGSVSWKDRDTIYVQTDFGTDSLTTSGYPRITKLWNRGTPLTEAKTVFEGESTDVRVSGYVIHTPERSYEVVRRGITFYTSHTYIIEAGRPVKLEIPDDAGFGGFFKNQMLVHLKSDWILDAQTYKQGALIGIDYDKYLQGSRTFSTIVEPNERSNVLSFSTTKNVLLVNLLNNVRSELYSLRLKEGRWEKERVDAPRFGRLSISSTDERSDRYFFTCESFLNPTSLYYVSDAREMRKTRHLPDFFDGSNLEVKQLEAVSRDGTRIPYFLVQPKSTKADGSNPTLLYAYGGFEISQVPSYSGVLGAGWLSRGGVYVLANIRGGGEFGPQWHRCALKENRQRCYDDFLAVAQDLIDRRITSPRHLGIMGGSNGGLLVGAAFTQRPDLFNAVVCLVPLLDMKRYNHLLAGASWMAEYGNPDIAEEWAYIKQYSPYHNLSADKKYPEVFFGTSTKDDRVHPGHARKMVAKMEGMGHKVYYYENTEGGHAATTTNRQRAMRTALIYSYLWTRLK